MNADITAAEWFASGRRIWYQPKTARVLTDQEPGALQVWERVTAATPGTGWLTLLPGFPEGSYGWSRVDQLLGDDLGPRLYVEPIGQGDSDKPHDYPYSTVERADLIEAVWRRHDVRSTVVVTFDYTSLALLEILRRRLERPGTGPEITAALIVNGGLYADAHTHPWQSTPLLRTPLGALSMRQAQRSPRIFASAITQARLYSRGYRPSTEELTEMWSAVTRHDGAAFLHNGAGFVAEHRRNARRWDFAAIAKELNGTIPFYVGGSTEDPYEHRQVQATRERVPDAEILTFPGGHLTTSEHPDLLANAIRRVANAHSATPNQSRKAMP
ncbi:MAG TPA: alpha/beta hydrolase [Pseudonocardiaceae bacterium]|nr:alpha/beta hydrolase [Pseudonocardiaceae bacterium]